MCHVVGLSGVIDMNIVIHDVYGKCDDGKFQRNNRTLYNVRRRDYT